MSSSPKQPKKRKPGKPPIERIIYIIIIVSLVLFGMIKDSEAAAKLIHAVYEAFSILFNTTAYE
ncbi:hypothetical protein D0T87_02575 [Bacteroides sp. 51]|nr:hypothetical protein [Bacteroides sp. 51]